jgi:membrane protease YdiL (CAAX protease family)
MRRFILNPGVILVVGLYLASLAVLSRVPDFQIGDAMVELVLFGLVLPLIAWATARRSPTLPITVRRSGSEVLLVVGLLIALAVYLVHGPQGIDALLPAAWSASPRIHFCVMLAKKLIVFVLLPFAAFRVLFGYRWRDFGVQFAGLRELARGHLAVVLSLSAVILAFQYFLGGAARPLREGQFDARQLIIALPLCFIWLAVEAGLVEEFFFRAVVQTRLTAWFKSEVTGVALMALVFGLAHAPGFIFRGAGEVEGLGPHPGMLDAVAYAIVVLAPGAIVFGVVWARTRNLLAVMIIHAAADLLPNLGAFIETWRVGR